MDHNYFLKCNILFGNQMKRFFLLFFQLLLAKDTYGSDLKSNGCTNKNLNERIKVYLTDDHNLNEWNLFLSYTCFKSIPLICLLIISFPRILFFSFSPISHFPIEFFRIFSSRNWCGLNGKKGNRSKWKKEMLVNSHCF